MLNVANGNQNANYADRDLVKAFEAYVASKKIRGEDADDIETLVVKFLQANEHLVKRDEITSAVSQVVSNALGVPHLQGALRTDEKFSKKIQNTLIKLEKHKKVRHIKQGYWQIMS